MMEHFAKTSFPKKFHYKCLAWSCKRPMAPIVQQECLLVQQERACSKQNKRLICWMSLKSTEKTPA